MQIVENGEGEKRVEAPKKRRIVRIIPKYGLKEGEKGPGR